MNGAFRRRAIDESEVRLQCRSAQWSDRGRGIRATRARKLASAPADMIVIDRHNYNRLQPLPIAWLRLRAVRTFLLIGSRNRIAVLLNWVCGWLTCGRGARLIGGEERTRAHAPQVSPVSRQGGAK